MNNRVLRLFYRNGCHLCEEMVSLIHRGWPDVMAGLEFVDVDSRADWRDRFGSRVPVLERDGVVLCELIPDSRCLQDHFGAPVNPI